MPAVSPSAVGCTGVAYSIGYRLRCDSTAFRTSSLSSTATVLIHVIDYSLFQLNACDDTETDTPAGPATPLRHRETHASDCRPRSGRARPATSPETRSASRDNRA